MSFFEELKRRNVFRVGVAYAVAAWLLLQLTEVLTELLELPTSIGKIVIALLVIGFPLALFFAWAFELTPEGVKREKDVDRSQSITPQTGKKLNRAIIAGLVLVIVAMGVERFWFAGQPAETIEVVRQGEKAPESAPAKEAPPAVAATQQESVAVLPFTAMSSGEDDEYFADGLTEEILNSLARLPELLVTARTSSFHFKGRDLPIPEIARTLGVDHVVEGSVRRAGERVRITAQLIRAEDGFHLWSDTYDRTLEDVFAVQEDIANSIAETLDVVLDEDKRRLMRKAGIGDVEAFIAYQKGLQLFFDAHVDIDTVEETLARAAPYFERALEVAPDLAAARVLKADAAGHVIFSSTGGMRPERFPGEAQQTLKSLREEYDLAWRSTPAGNQRDILDVERTLFREDWSGLGATLDLALQPGDCSQTNWTSELAIGVAHRPAIVEKTRERLRCDPLNPVARFTIAMALMWNGQHEAAMDAVREAQESGVTFDWLNTIEGLILLAAGDLDNPRINVLSGPGGWIRFPREVMRFAREGKLDPAHELAGRFMAEQGGDDWSGVSLSAIIGDRDAANRHAARIDARPGGSLLLTNIVYVCACGVPFDLEATPNFRRNLAEAGFDWPPPTVIHYPAKDW